MTVPVLRGAGDETRRVALEAEINRLQSELVALKLELQKIQREYLGKMGEFYGELATLEAAIAEAEVAAGLRPPPAEDAEEDAPAGDEPVTVGAADRTPPSDELKRMFRDVAKSIHPDLALDEPARCRRHSLMAEANRAYAERDADRLRLILQAWEQDPDGAADELGGGSGRVRGVAELEDRLAALKAEMAALRRSAIFKLKQKIDRTHAEGWDLMAEMVLQVKSEIARARVRLAKLEKP